jgi:hypothetical protein
MKTKGLFTFLVLAVLSVNSIAQENEKRFGIELNSEVSIVSIYQRLRWLGLYPL